jgi:tetratricopeptide (TPR) repeat protein
MTGTRIAVLLAAAAAVTPAVQVSVSGRGEGRRFSIQGSASALEILREVASAAECRIEEPDAALLPFLRTRVLCEVTGLDLEDACTAIAGACDLRAEVSDPGTIRVRGLDPLPPAAGAAAVTDALDLLTLHRDRLAAIDPDSPALVDAALTLGSAWLAAGHAIRASAEFAWVDSGPGARHSGSSARRLARLGLARCDVDSGRPSAGYAAAEKIAAENAFDEATVRAAVLLAREALARRDGGLAVERASLAVAVGELDREILDVLDAAISVCEDDPSRRKAFEDLSRALESRRPLPRDARLRLALSRIALALGNPRAAVAEVSRAILLDPEGPDVAEALRVLGNQSAASSPATALLCLESVRSRPGPASGPAALDAARIYRRLGLFDLARERYSEAAGIVADEEEASIRDPLAAAELAELLLAEGRSGRASEIYEMLHRVPGFASAATLGLIRARLAKQDLMGALEATRASGETLAGDDRSAARAAVSAALARTGQEPAALSVLFGALPAAPGGSR